VKNVLLQLDTNEHPSPFDSIVAVDADVDVLLSHGGVKPDGVRALAQDAFFTRGPDDLRTIAVWVGGKDVAAGEAIFSEVQNAFFGPFRVSVMLDSNGCNTTAATTVARIAKARSLAGSRTVVVGLGAVGLRSAVLLQKERGEVTVATLPPDLFGDDRPYIEEAGGKDALVGHRGVRLSGGQVQRLALARALATDAELLLADDVSSALDAATEIELWAALRERRMTVIGATAKRAALAQADRVVVLVDGEVAAIGPWHRIAHGWGHLAG
jgi:hypothetical protein